MLSGVSDSLEIRHFDTNAGVIEGKINVYRGAGPGPGPAANTLSHCVGI